MKVAVRKNTSEIIVRAHDLYARASECERKSRSHIQCMRALWCTHFGCVQIDGLCVSGMLAASVRGRERDERVRERDMKYGNRSDYL